MRQLLLRLVALLVLGVPIFVTVIDRGATATPPRPRRTSPRPPASESVHVVTVGWYHKAELLADRRALGRYLRRATLTTTEGASRHYRIPDGSYALGAHVVRGIHQPAFYYYSLRDTAFMYSWGRYWPASCVKLHAAVGALSLLHDHGLTARAQITLDDDDGHFSGPVSALQRRALRVSSNVGYNRLMEIASLDYLNDTILSPHFGMPKMTLQRRYTKPLPTSSLRRSPPIHYRLGKDHGAFPERRSSKTYARCPREANCVTLFELQEALRRVMLHGEIPAAERFPMNRSDVRRLQADLLASPCKLKNAEIEAGLGVPAAVYNKAGQVPGDDHLDNMFLVEKGGRRRWLLTLLVPYGAPKEPPDVTKAELGVFGREALKVLRRLPHRGPPLQADTGPGVTLEFGPVVSSPQSHLRGQIRVRAIPILPGSPITAGQRPASHATVWIDHRRLTPRGGIPLPAHLHVPYQRKGEHALVIVTRRNHRDVGYRFIAIDVR